MRVDAGWGKWLEMNHSSWLTKTEKGGLILKRQFSYCVIVQNDLLLWGDAVMSTVVSQQEGPCPGDVSCFSLFLCSPGKLVQRCELTSLYVGPAMTAIMILLCYNAPCVHHHILPYIHGLQSSPPLEDNQNTFAPHLLNSQLLCISLESH